MKLGAVKSVSNEFSAEAIRVFAERLGLIRADLPLVLRGARLGGSVTALAHQCRQRGGRTSAVLLPQLFT